ncbi:Ribosome biogenesis protein erb1 [Maublancomyces gigas]|uniref:peptidyl-tRNA hydrolase n=1 Tax=Discina gigas TaxID=1032678 RepID=A0ABR3GIU2_9PEZI
MEMSTLSPLVPIILTAIFSVLAGYYVGKTAGLRAAERAYRLAEKVTGQQEKDRNAQEKPKVVESGSEEDWESEDEDDDAEVADIKKFEDSDEPCKMGKIAAQCGHATLMCFKSSQKLAPHLIHNWEKFGQAKIALQAKGGEDELVMLQAQAMSLGVVAKIVHDAGLTQIVAGSATVLGIGPAPVSVVNQITGHLKLL